MNKRVRYVMGFVIAILTGCIFLSVQAKEVDPLEIMYFYNNACGSCDVETEFYQVFNEQVGELKGSINYEINLYNTFQLESKEYFDQVCDVLGISEEEKFQPILVIGEKYLVGKEGISSKLKEVFIEQAEKMPKRVIKEAEKEGGKVEGIEAGETDNSHFVYFYTVSCNDCKKTKALLDALDGEYDFQVVAHNIGEGEGTALVSSYFKKYEVPDQDQQVPIIFYQGGYLSGYEAIEKELKTVIEAGDAYQENIEVEVEKVEPFTIGDFPKLFITGFINGFNPCSISMLLLLISLMSVQAPVLKLGLTYILGKIVTYLTLGTVFYSLIAVLNTAWFQSIQSIINGVIIALLLVLALMNMLDFLAAKKESYHKIRMQLPTKLRRFNHELIKKFVRKSHTKYAVVGIFVLGVIISAGEFLCTGQIYLATILYLLKRMETYSFLTFMALLIYVIAMALPLCGIIFAVYKGQKVLAVSEFVRKNMMIIKLVNAIVFLMFAILIILI